MGNVQRATLQDLTLAGGLLVTSQILNPTQKCLTICIIEKELAEIVWRNELIWQVSCGHDRRVVVTDVEDCLIVAAHEVKDQDFCKVST